MTANQNQVKFTPHAAYFSSLDCIEYVNRDCTMISERVDSLLTLYRKNGTNEYVGFKIKGFRSYFQTELKPALSLAEQDFSMLKNIMVTICHQMAPKFLSQDYSNGTKSKEAYKIAMKMANDEAIKLSNFDDVKVAA